MEINEAKSADHTDEGWRVISVLRKMLAEQAALDSKQAGK